jgi:cell division protein FtsB
MRTTSTLILIALLCFAVTTAGCDSHKAERASLLQQISDSETELASLNERFAAVSRELESLPCVFDRND